MEISQEGQGIACDLGERELVIEYIWGIFL